MSENNKNYKSTNKQLLRGLKLNLKSSLDLAIWQFKYLKRKEYLSIFRVMTGQIGRHVYMFLKSSILRKQLTEVKDV